MIAQIRGTCLSTGSGTVVVEVNGLGLLATVPDQTAAACVVGQECTLYTLLIVRENEISLVGFESPKEREFFKLLTSISGIGPKAAVKILSTLSPAALAAAIIDNDIASLTKISGIGPKIAKRLLLELSEKISKMGSELVADTKGPETTAHQDAIKILASLGCTMEEASAAVDKIKDTLEPEATSETVVMAAMRVLGQQVS